MKCFISPFEKTIVIERAWKHQSLLTCTFFTFSLDIYIYRESNVKKTVDVVGLFISDSNESNKNVTKYL